MKLNIKCKKCNFSKVRLISKSDFSDIKNDKPDYFIVVNWRTVFPDQLLDIPKKYAIGIHASDLPKYRGFAPVNWALINNEKILGCSIFCLGKEVDTGDILLKEEWRTEFLSNQKLILNLR